MQCPVVGPAPSLHPRSRSAGAAEILANVHSQAPGARAECRVQLEQFGGLSWYVDPAVGQRGRETGNAFATGLA